MKKIFLTLSLSFAFSAALTAQDQKLFLTGIFSTDDQDYKEYKYNEINKLDTMYHLDDAMGIDRYIIYEYNDNGDCVKCTYLPYNGFEYSSPSHVIEFVYNDKNQLVERIVNTVRDGISNVTGKNLYTYNEAGQNDTIKQIVPVATGSETMKLLAYTMYKYDSAGRVVTDETYNNDNFFGDEVVLNPNSRNTYTYDKDGNLTSIVGGMYEPTVSAYLDSYKYEYVIDGNGDRRKMSYYLWSNSISNWSCEHYIEYAYNTRTSIDKCILPDEIEFTWPDFQDMKHQPATESWYYFDEYQQDFLLGYEYDYVFEEKAGVSGGAEMTDNRISFYPNPAGDVITLCGDVFGKVNVKVYDMDGRCVMNKTAENTVDVSSLAKGMYLIDIDGSKARLLKK